MNVGPNRDQRSSLLLIQDDTTQSHQNHPVLQPAKWHDQMLTPYGQVLTRNNNLNRHKNVVRWNNE